MPGAWTPARILWSLRKARLPIGSSDLVLEVGSGSNPHPASDILLEKYVDSSHRHETLVADRPIVLADACQMPFRDKAFDYVIAFHVLEHIAQPDKFLHELERVGKAGYIEVPNAVFERLNPYEVHLLEIMAINGRLVIHKKTSPRLDCFLTDLKLTTASREWNRLFYGNPELFHVRYFWRDRIDFSVVNPDASTSWFVDPRLGVDGEIRKGTGKRDLRGVGLKLLREWYKLRKRRKVTLADVLACPLCKGSLSLRDKWMDCERCATSYPTNPIADFNHGVPIAKVVEG